MTKKERAQVVELLRCAADGTDWTYDVVTTGREQGYSSAVVQTACAARWAVSDERRGAWDGSSKYNREDRLEAAQRVEEGSYP